MPAEVRRGGGAKRHKGKGRHSDGLRGIAQQTGFLGSFLGGPLAPKVLRLGSSGPADSWAITAQALRKLTQPEVARRLVPDIEDSDEQVHAAALECRYAVLRDREGNDVAFPPPVRRPSNARSSGPERIECDRR
jgi:hypothetical protein